MPSRRRIALVAAGALALVLLLLALFPLLFRAPLERKLKAGINRSVAAHVDWRRAGLGLFRDFPNLTLRLDELVVAGTDRFANDTLLSVGRTRVVLDLGSVLRSLRRDAAVVVRSVDLERPYARLVVLEDGTANWNILRPSTNPDPGAARPLAISLRSLEVHDGALRLENRQANLHASITGLRESLRGDFSRQRFTLSTRTSADTVSLRFAGVPYLSRARLQVAADLDVDTDARRVEISENEIRLNELVLRARGAVAAADDSVLLDLAFSTPGTAFADILSLVPAVYRQGFATLQSSGTMVVSGTVRGGYGAQAFPAIAVAAKVENGAFRYPDLPLPAREVTLDFSVDNPGGHADRTTVTLHRLHLVLGGDPIDGSFVLRTPISDPDVALQLKGRLDLGNLGRTVKLENVAELAGVVVADAHMRARRSDLDAQRYGQVSAGGGLSVAGLVFQGAALRHELRIDAAELRLTPAHAELASLRGTIGRSDLEASGRLDNLLGFVLHEQELRGAARVRSRHLDLDEWRSDDETRAVPVPRNIDFSLQATADRVTFAELELRNARGALRVKEQRVTLEDFAMDMLGGAVAISGFYETTDPARPTFDVDLEAEGLDIQAAFAGLRTVQAFAPVARYARGSVSTDLALRGALGADLMPVREVLSGIGSLTTMGVVLQDFPALDRLADALHVDLLRDPGFRDLTSSIEIRDGRLHVQPFDVGVGPLTMTVAGSNGFDHSLAYDLGLQLPRALLGTDANRVIAGLVARAGRSGVELEAAETVTVGVQLGGTVTEPTIATSFQELAGSAVAGVRQAIRDEAASRVDSARLRLDAAAADARARAQAMIADAEQRAEALRAEARRHAASMKEETKARADSLVARAGNPVARAAAQAAADRLRREADAQADEVVRQADAQADALVAEARRRAAAPDSAAAP